jgi:hypothetical protein
LLDLLAMKQACPLPIRFERKLNVKKARRLAPFFRKYRERSAYSKLPETLRIAYEDGLLTDDGKLFYVKNSKAGCTSIAQLLYHYSKGDFCGENIHDARKTLRQYRDHWRDFEEALGGSAVAFTFVRHPESRLVSAFRNFFVDRKNRAHLLHLPAMESRGFNGNNSQSKNFGIFLDYVEESIAIDPLYTDRHWRSQHINIASNDIDYTVIGRLENFYCDLKKVFARIGQSAFLTEDRISARFNRSKDHSSNLTASERSRIETIYARDYELFGY